VVAAGGDGTVSAVAGGLVGTDVPLGILPLGTGNILARELNVPIDLDAACGLIAGAHGLTAVDALRARGRYFFTHVGVGVDALMIRDTSKEQKKRFGRMAYMWTAVKRLVGFEPRRFSIRLEGERARRVHACEVLVANCRTLGQKPLSWGPHIRLDDGKADICIVKARTLLEYLKVTVAMLRGRHRESPIVSYLEVTSAVEISSSRALPVQADGEIIGETPITVEVVPGAVRIMTPVEGVG
jgi:YegS/Rv2252/BmrU family lipid kinase